jgi:hypothetical protein
MPSGFGRDYGPGASEHWLVWEQADRERLAGWLLDPVKACSRMNDEPAMILNIEEIVR